MQELLFFITYINYERTVTNQRKVKNQDFKKITFYINLKLLRLNNLYANNIHE